VVFKGSSNLHGKLRDGLVSTSLTKLLLRQYYDSRREKSSISRVSERRILKFLRGGQMQIIMA